MTLTYVTVTMLEGQENVRMCTLVIYVRLGRKYYKNEMNINCLNFLSLCLSLSLSVSLPPTPTLSLSRSLSLSHSLSCLVFVLIYIGSNTDLSDVTLYLSCMFVYVSRPQKLAAQMMRDNHVQV